MSSTDSTQTSQNDPESFTSIRSANEHDTPVPQQQFDSSSPTTTPQRQFLVHAQQQQQPPSSSSSPSIVRNPSPPLNDNLSREDMVGDEMYSKSWFCRVLLKLIEFVSPQQSHDAFLAHIRQQGHLSPSSTSDHITEKKRALDGTFEAELCELWDVSTSADVAHLLIEFKSLDLFHSVLFECEDKRCTEIVLGILSNMACCKRNLDENDTTKSVAQCIIQHSNLFSTVLSILTSDDYSDCPTLVQLFRLIYTLLVRQDTRIAMFEHVQLTYEPICFILQSCCNEDLLYQCSSLLRVLLDECELFDNGEQHEVAYLFLTSMTTAISALIEDETILMTKIHILENLFNCLQIYTTYEHLFDILNDHCEILIDLIEHILIRLVQDDVVQIRSILLVSCISLFNFFLNKHGFRLIKKNLLECFLKIGHACYKDRQRREEHQKQIVRRQRSRTHSSGKRRENDTANTNGKTVSEERLSKSYDDESEVTTTVDYDRSVSEDLSTTAYGLVDELFLEIFYRAIKQESTSSPSTIIFSQLNQDQRELFRKIIKHFCNLDKRLDDLLDL